MHYRLVRFTVPLSCYAFDSASLTFNDGSARTATLNGNFTTATLPAALKTAMETESGDTFTVTVNAATQLLTIASSGTFSIQTNAAWERLGFPADAATGASHTGSDIVDLNPFRDRALMVRVTSNDRNLVTLASSAPSVAAFSVPVNVSLFIFSSKCLAFNPFNPWATLPPPKPSPGSTWRR